MPGTHLTGALRVLSLNIRATQGGAGRVGYDLHHRLRAAGHHSRLLYGYGSGIAPDPQVAEEPDVEMIGSRPVVLANYAAHLLLGREVATARRRKVRDAIAQADVVHLHAAHHWYLHWESLARMLGESGKPVVITAHDWWLLTGRCGFVGDCTGWQRACGECGPRRFEDLPALLDRSRVVRESRQRALRAIGDRLTIVCPSHHLARDHRSVFPDLDVVCIPNALDRGFEAGLAAASPAQPREGYLFCASDLAAPGKVDPELVRALAAEPGLSVGLIGRGNPFRDTSAVSHGEVRSRAKLAALYGRARGLLFSSRMDNAPLTIIEALSAGCPVLAYRSAAAQEMLALVGGRCVQSPAEALALVRAGREAALYGGISHAELARRARHVWSGVAMTNAYLSVYRGALGVASGREAA
jgi:putative colanic acid biosynthesis glycosyltransferase